MNAECCVLTPPGRGAVAVVEVTGVDRLAAVEGLFIAASGKPLAEQPIDSIRFGRWKSETGEEVVVVRRTGSIEVHCHGGRAASSGVVASLVERGAVEITTDERLERTEAYSLRAAARRAMEQAPTERVAMVLLDQYQGALEREIVAIVEQLGLGNTIAAEPRLEQLVGTWQAGRWLSRPARVVLTGPPNVGKSSLINCLLGYERAIVFDQPGTTRDVVTAPTAINGWPVVLSDTAGLREGEGEIERAGIELARGAVAQADLVIEVVDASDQEPQPGGAASINVANKVDRVEPQRRAEWEGEGYLPTSATTGENIERLLAEIAHRLVPQEPVGGAGVLFREVDLIAVSEALSACRAREPQRATGQLERLVAASRNAGFNCESP